MVIIGITSLCIIILTLAICLYHSTHVNQEIIQLNEERQLANQQLEQQGEKLQKQLNDISIQFDDKTAALERLTSSVNETSRQYETIARERAEEKYKEKTASLELEYQIKKQELEDLTRQSLLDYKLVKNQVEDLQAKQLAYVQMKQREEEMKSKQDYYRLILPEEELQDIKYLREMQSRIIHKEAIDKVIWESYYRPYYNQLVSRLALDDKKSGIYCITSLNNGLRYIGQSLDIKERWRQHIKTALAQGRATNKLYQEMKKQGIDNFTFEILEEVPRDKLNEREVYWIDFFKSKDFGMNGNIGGS